MKKLDNGVLIGVVKRKIGKLDIPPGIKELVIKQFDRNTMNIPLSKEASKRIVAMTELHGSCVVSKSNNSWCVYSLNGWKNKNKNLIVGHKTQ